MQFTVLTQTSGLLGPFAKVIGTIFNYLYRFFAHFGIHNVGLCIILLVVIVRIIMIPLTIKQQKFTKMNSIIQPEVNAINKKYEGKKDQESLMAKNEELTELYRKYGVSPSGGCLNMLIQLPIMLGLYQVIMKIPAYVPQIKAHYTNIIDKVGADKLLNSEIIKEAAKNGHIKLENLDGKTETVNKLVDVMFKFDNENWENLNKAFSGSSDVITKSMHKIENANNFLGMNLTLSPSNLVGLGVKAAILIPILAALTQFISSKLMMADQGGNDDDNPMAASLKTMTYTMPILSAFMCYSFATCIGVYWIASTVITTIIQLGVTKYYDSIPVEVIVERNKQKAAERRAKLGIDDNALKNASVMKSKSMKNISEKMNEIYKENKRMSDELNGKNNSETSTNDDGSNETIEKSASEPKPGSIASKARLADKYKK